MKQASADIKNSNRFGFKKSFLQYQGEEDKKYRNIIITT